MTAPTRYRERAESHGTHVEVEVFSIPSWGAPEGSSPEFHVVRYPDCSGIAASRIEENLIKNALQTLADDGFLEEDVEKIDKWLRQPIPGREYIIDSVTLDRHFEVLPQTFRIQAWGQVFQRPMKSQRELDETIEDAEALAAQLDTDPEGSNG
jgi:hypothetical protein